MKLAHNEYKDETVVISSEEVYFDENGIGEFQSDEVVKLALKELRGFRVHNEQPKDEITEDVKTIEEKIAPVDNSVSEESVIEEKHTSVINNKPVSDNNYKNHNYNKHNQQNYKNKR